MPSRGRRSPLATPLCDLLGIDLPILQSGMGSTAGPDLVAAVSAAGGLGILGGLGFTAALTRARIGRVRELTDRPFGVNQWLHPTIRPPADPAALRDEQIREVQGRLNGFRKTLGIPERDGAPPPYPDTVEEVFETILEERVAVWSVGLGDPGPEMVRRCHERGIRVIAMACTVEDARALAASGVDAVVAQGGDAGGHRSTWVKAPTVQQAAIGTMALVPAVVDALRIPIVAAGGITDGRGLLAALALGAQGALLGTRFVATRESAAPDFWKRALIEESGDGTVLSDAFTGLWARVVSNRFSEEYAASGTPTLPGMLQATAASDLTEGSAARGEAGYYPLYAGEGAATVRDLPGAGEVVRSIAREAADLLGRLGG